MKKVEFHDFEFFNVILIFDIYIFNLTKKSPNFLVTSLSLIRHAIVPCS